MQFRNFQIQILPTCSPSEKSLSFKSCKIQNKKGVISRLARSGGSRCDWQKTEHRGDPVAPVITEYPGEGWDSDPYECFASA